MLFLFLHMGNSTEIGTITEVFTLGRSEVDCGTIIVTVPGLDTTMDLINEIGGQCVITMLSIKLGCTQIAS